MVVFMENSAEAVMAFFGILKAGAAFVIVNPTVKAEKLVFVLNDCAASVIVGGRPLQPILDETLRGAVSLRAAFAVGWQAPIDGRFEIPVLECERVLSSFSPEAPPRQCIDIDLAALIYTSGSTGIPKGVTVSHQNVIAAATSITQYLENVPQDVILNVLPLSFDYGLYQAIMSAKTGATLILEKSFAYPYEMIRRIREERVTGFPGVPTVFALLLRLKDLDPVDFDSLRYVTNTGAALPEAHIRRMCGLFRRARIYSMYGVTECKRVSYLPPEEIERRPTSVGRAIPNTEAYVVDEDGHQVGPGVVGELVVRGSNVMQGYWNRPEETARVLRPGRYPWERVLFTGDLFRMDEDGYLYFVARKDDIIKSRGEKVSPREVENVILELPDVCEAAVVGEPDPILGQAVKAIIVKTDGSALKETDVIAHCTRRLEGFMVPKRVVFTDSLPKTSSGKISHAALRVTAPRVESARVDQ
ncbi:MAG: AMP-binding protein [Rubrivivax sp.]|nr:AMP-binding protein [Rubrivivax sp.]